MHLEIGSASALNAGSSGIRFDFFRDFDKIKVHQKMDNLVENATDFARRHPTKLTLSLLATSISLFVATKYEFFLKQSNEA